MTCTRTCCASACSRRTSSHRTVSGSDGSVALIFSFFLFLSFLDYFNIFSFFPSPDFLGRTKVPVATIKKEMEVKGAASRHFLLHEVATGEVCVKLDLQLYDK